MIYDSWSLIPWRRLHSLGECCNAVNGDPECGNNFIYHHISGRCYCEKKGYDCPRHLGTYNEYRLPEPQQGKDLISINGHK